MTDQELNEIEARAAKATPGPWESRLDVFDPDEPEIEACVSDAPVTLLARISTEISVDPIVGADSETWDRAYASQALTDAKFVASARADIPALVAEVKRLRAAQKLALEALDRGIKSGNEEAVNCYAEDDIREAIAALADPGPR